jgi:hypothetical protein
MPYFLGVIKEDNVFIVALPVEMNIQRGRKMKYKCKKCDFIIDDLYYKNNLVERISSHEKTHNK